MAFFRPLIDATRQLWFTLDTASALLHRGEVSPGARRYIMTDATAAESESESVSESAPAPVATPAAA